MNLTLNVVTLNGKPVVLADDADLTKYPAGAVQPYALDYREPDTESELQAACLIAEYNLPRDATGQVPEKAERIAYCLSFLRAHVTGMKTPSAESAVKPGEALAKGVAAKLPLSVVQEFVGRVDPAQITAREYKAVGELLARGESEAGSASGRTPTTNS